MNKKIKLSVMITTYNLKRYIDETLESVLNQNTKFKYEILIGDDGSDDGTIEILKQWEERYPKLIKLYVMERNPNKTHNRISRASKNRLNLLKQASGEYLIFLDGDDVYTDEYKLQKQVDILDKKDNLDCIACAHNIWVYWNEEKKHLLNTAEEQRKIKGSDYWKYGMYFHSDTIMFRNIFDKDSIKKMPKNYYDDNIIMFYLLEYGDIIYIPDTMTNYRQLENSSWNSVNEIEKHIINIMDWDIELRINNQLEKETITRHLYSILYLWKQRNHIPEDIKSRFMYQINRDDLTNARKWVDFRSHSLIKRCGYTIWLFIKLIQFVFIKMKKQSTEYKVN